MEDIVISNNEVNKKHIKMQKLTLEALGIAEDLSAEKLKAQISYKARLKSDGHKMNGGSGSQVKCRCPFHDDSTPSFSISKADDFGICFGCDWKGDIVQYEREFHSVDYPTALKRLEEWRISGANGNGRVATPEVATAPFAYTGEQKASVQKASSLLAGNMALVERVAAAKEWTASTILRLAQENDLGWWDGLLGFHYSTGVKLRNWPHRDMHWKLGGNGLWRDRLLEKSSTIYLAEGESDAITILDCGVEQDPDTAVLAVPGASGFKKAWAQRFAGKAVITCFDNDEPGIEMGKRIHPLLKPVVASLRMHTLKGAK